MHDCATVFVPGSVGSHPAFPQRGKENTPLTLTLSRKRERE